MFIFSSANLFHMQPTKQSCITRVHFVLNRPLSVFLRCMPHSGWTQHFYFTDSLNTCTLKVCLLKNFLMAVIHSPTCVQMNITYQGHLIT